MGSAPSTRVVKIVNFLVTSNKKTTEVAFEDAPPSQEPGALAGRNLPHNSETNFNAAAGVGKLAVPAAEPLQKPKRCQQRPVPIITCGAENSQEELATESKCASPIRKPRCSRARPAPIVTCSGQNLEEEPANDRKCASPLRKPRRSRPRPVPIETCSAQNLDEEMQAPCRACGLQRRLVGGSGSLLCAGCWLNSQERLPDHVGHAQASSAPGKQETQPLARPLATSPSRKKIVHQSCHDTTAEHAQFVRGLIRTASAPAVLPRTRSRPNITPFVFGKVKGVVQDASGGVHDVSVPSQFLKQSLSASKAAAACTALGLIESSGAGWDYNSKSRSRTFRNDARSDGELATQRLRPTSAPSAFGKTIDLDQASMGKSPDVVQLPRRPRSASNVSHLPEYNHRLPRSYSIQSIRADKGSELSPSRILAAASPAKRSERREQSRALLDRRPRSNMMRRRLSQCS